MGNINVLDDKTIDKIAAGEVIERPASVVKELVENSIDSGATAITVEIKEGGISYIRVTDNGCGILKDDVKNAFLRHATSKIKDVMDLFKISSLGFRGEALSSISAVSSVELLTKTGNDFSGTRYIITGGREEIFEDAGVPNGATIIVKNLFYNTPARKKFLKSPNTEASHITELMEHLILSHPEVSFKYMINGIDRLVSSGNNDIKTAVYSIFGKDAINNMIPINATSEYANVAGLIGKPEIARGNRSFEIIFVNNRYIKSKVISSAIEEAFKHRLMLHKYPFTVLYLDIDPSKLDINVHPTKTEIKFMDEINLFRFLSEQIDSVLSKSELIPSVKAETKQTINVSHQIVEKAITPAKQINAPEPFEFNRKVNENKIIKTEVTKPIPKTESVQIKLFEDLFISEEAAKKHNIIGQIFDTYWLVEFDGCLFIIDQHAAHEKVLYEKYIKRLKDSSINSQMISPPEIISLSVLEEDTLHKYSSNLIQMGFEWEPFGGQEYALSGVPTDLYSLSCKDYFISVIDDLAEGKVQTPDAINDRIATMACKAAVKGNMHLSNAEAKALIDELLKLENPYNCPHGRPCIISYSKDELEKLFKRIV